MGCEFWSYEESEKTILFQLESRLKNSKELQACTEDAQNVPSKKIDGISIHVVSSRMNLVTVTMELRVAIFETKIHPSNTYV